MRLPCPWLFPPRPPRAAPPYPAGAELAAVVREAALAALREDLQARVGVCLGVRVCACDARPPSLLNVRHPPHCDPQGAQEVAARHVEAALKSVRAQTGHWQVVSHVGP